MSRNFYWPLLHYLAYLQPHLGTEMQVPQRFSSLTACGTDSILTGLKTNKDHHSLQSIYSAPRTWEPNTCSEGLLAPTPGREISRRRKNTLCYQTPASSSSPPIFWSPEHSGLEHCYQPFFFYLCSPSFIGFPGGLVDKESACQCRRHRRCGFNP